MKLNIAIIGSRGIPNNYGGFEQMAQWLATGLLDKGHEVTVYNSHDHPYKEKEWNGVKLIHCYDAEKAIGTAGQFIYDLNCIRNARKNKYDVILFLGYTSSSVWGRLFPKHAVIISNMDGLEWKRSKYSKPVRRFLEYAERLAVKYSHFLISDSTAIQYYLFKKYKTETKYIPYGAEISTAANESLLKEFGLIKDNYYMLMARMEPENNIDMILDGFCRSDSANKFIVTGNHNNTFGKKMYHKYGHDERVHFAGAVFDDEKTTALRTFCELYFHGHSVGGTNPSLLEAMANGAVIAAHDNEFNRSVLQEDAFYFNTAEGVLQIINEYKEANTAAMVQHNLKKIEEQFNWPAIINSYEEFIIDCYNRSAI
jgi:glycosyltransferase involved in cell wall biosynthesis